MSTTSGTATAQSSRWDELSTLPFKESYPHPREARDELRSTVEQASESAPRKSLEKAGRDPLSDLRKRLSEEYKDQPDARIDEAVKQAFDRLAGAKIREFVPLFAWRHAREYLRRAP